MDSFQAKDYGSYLEHDFRHRWLRPHHLKQKLIKYTSHSEFLIEQIGLSTEGREISIAKWGKGSIKILCWTQMHGNEPTATMAMIDILNFLFHSDSYNDLRDRLVSQVQLVFIPMLNPDGAEAYNRRTALGVDPNRDALVQQTPEIQTLLRVVDEFKPNWCFNLHDQRNIFSAGDTRHTATISFLAASADVSKSLTLARKQSMSLIGVMHEAIKEILPNHVGRYTDEYYHRALGEYFHKNEIPCILVESGAFKADPMRDTARKANFLALLKAFEIIAMDKVNPEHIDAYNTIPENKTNLLDFVIRDCAIDVNGTISKVDLGLLYEEKPNFETNLLERTYMLNDIGDLQFQYGIEEEQGAILTSSYKNLKIGSSANFTINLHNNKILEFKNGILQ